MTRVIGGRLPDQLVDVDVAQDDRHLDAGRPQPQEHLPCAAQFAELGEHQADRLGDMLVGIDLDLARLAPAEAGRQHEAELAAPRLRVARREAALPHQAQLVFRHRPLQPEQQAVVDESRIVGAVRIDDQRCRPARTDRSDDASPVHCAPSATPRCSRRRRHRRSRPAPPAVRSPAAAIRPDPERPRSSSITVTDGKARRFRRLRQIVLSALAFEIAGDLRHRRLPHVDDRGASEMISRDLAAHRRLPRSPLSSSSTPSAASRRSASASTSPCRASLSPALADPDARSSRTSCPRPDTVCSAPSLSFGSKDGIVRPAFDPGRTGRERRQAR